MQDGSIQERDATWDSLLRTRLGFPDSPELGISPVQGVERLTFTSLRELDAHLKQQKNPQGDEKLRQTFYKELNDWLDNERWVPTKQ